MTLAPTLSPSAGDGLVFVLGLPSSGSETVAQALASRADTLVVTPWLAHPLAYTLRWDGSDADYDSFAARRGLAAFAALLPGGESDVDDVLAEALYSLYRRALAHAGKSLLVDASPRLYRVAAELARWYPAARFVIALRHPAAALRAVVDEHCDGDISRLALRDDLYRDLTEAPALLAEAVRALGERACVLHHEDWAHTPGRLAQCLASFGVAAADDAPPAATPAQSLLAAAVTRAQGGAPGDALLAHAAAYLEAIGTDTLAALGYGSALHGLALALDGDSVHAAHLLAPTAPLAGAAPDTTPAPVALAPDDDAAVPVAVQRARALNTAGEALHARGAVDEAAAAFLQAAQLDPAGARPLNNLGAVLWQRGQQPLATWCFARAVQVDPDDTGAWFNLCDALGAQQCSSQAKALLSRLMLARPDDESVVQAFLTN